MKLYTCTYRSLIIAVIATLVGALCACEEVDNNNDTLGLGWVNFSIDLKNNELAPQNGSFTLCLSQADSEFSHVWPDITDFPEYDSFYVGSYIAEVNSGNINAEGYGCQAYYGKCEFQILDGVTVKIPIPCNIAQTLAIATITDQSSDYDVDGVIFHTLGWGYIEALEDMPTPALLHPGKTIAWLTIKDTNGNAITLDPGISIDTESGHLNTCSIHLGEDNVMQVKWGDYSKDIELSENIFNSSAPIIHPVGFTPDLPVKLVEGYPAPETIGMNIHAEAGLSAVIVSIQSDNNDIFDFPYEFDVFEDYEVLEEHGWVIKRDGDCNLSIDFTGGIEELSIDYNSNITFDVVACDRLMRLSDIMSLQVELESVDILDINCTKALLGENIATLSLKMTTDIVQTTDFKLISIDAETGEESGELPILKSEIDKDSDIVKLTFPIEEGIAPVTVRIYYLNKPRSEVIVNRAVPEYTLSLDAFSTYMLAQIGIESKSAMREITKYVHFYDGEKQYAVTERNPEKGLLKIDGLSPASAYSLSAIVISGEYSPEEQIRTEAAGILPAGDFEDVKFCFSYDNLPQGGAYSSTSFPIYNMQNISSIYVSMPEKYWGDVNTKTFNEAAKYHNTWYMQPSAQIDNSLSVSGSKSVKITSVGWSLEGEEIPPYVQSEDTYLPYNNNIPERGHVSAGRLFLGDYKFDPITLKETYNEGIKFDSRPSSLNGFVRYIPDKQNDQDVGIVAISLVNDDLQPPVTIAQAVMEIKPCSDFIAFNLPLTYEIFGVKATRLKLMFCSSSQYGSIEDEDNYVPVTADVEKSCYIGSQMWVDNLSFSY